MHTDTIHQQPLSEREKQILSEVIKGQLNKEVAATFSISIETVKKHVRNIYTKLNVRNRAEAIRVTITQDRCMH